MDLEPLTAISPIDGRYRVAAASLSAYFSEYALIKYRVLVECEYLVALSKTSKLGIRKLSEKETGMLRKIEEVSVDDAKAVKAIEKETNHDVKAIEYFLKQKLAARRS